MGLYHHNVPCFDSESFRNLVARKRGVEMGHREDNARSWDKSVTESTASSSPEHEHHSAVDGTDGADRTEDPSQHCGE